MADPDSTFRNLILLMRPTFSRQNRNDGPFFLVVNVESKTHK